MAIRRVNLVYDDQKHSIVHLGLANHSEDSDAAYLRKCVEFFEMNKGGLTNQQLILERLQRIENMLKSGVTVGDAALPDTSTDEMFDDLLAQLE
jgi:hypothetical protein